MPRHSACIQRAFLLGAIGVGILIGLAPPANADSGARKQSPGPVAAREDSERKAAGSETDRSGGKSEETASPQSGDASVPLVQKTFSIDVTLGDGRQLSGRIRVRLPERVAIQHTVNGIEYRKVVRPEEIRAIELKRWRGRMVRQQESGQIFQFDVDRYTLELAGGQVLTREGELFSFLTSFVLENQHGSVQLYSFWGDLQKKDGSWFSGMEGPTASRVLCHKDVVKRIDFNEN
jgi:hypothetical protein